MKKFKFILPVLVLILMLASCEQVNEEYLGMEHELEQLDFEVSNFISAQQDYIDEKSDTYELLLSSYEKQAELETSAKILMNEIAAIKETVSEEEYSQLVEKMHTLNDNIKSSTVKTDENYVLSVAKKVEEIIAEYASSDSKIGYDTASAAELIDQINSLTDYALFEGDNLQGQATILNNFISCIDAYSSYHEQSKQFAADSYSSENKETSLVLVNSYMETVNAAYELNMQAIKSVSTLDKTSVNNIDIFVEALSPLNEEYAIVIDNLNFVIKQ